MARAFFFVIALPRACTFFGLKIKDLFLSIGVEILPPIHLLAISLLHKFKGDCLLKASIKLHMVGCGGAVPSPCQGS
jgi:hypothetical protein